MTFYVRFMKYLINTYFLRRSIYCLTENCHQQLKRKHMIYVYLTVRESGFLNNRPESVSDVGRLENETRV